MRECGLVLAIVCPGQGSQTPGFLAPWLELPDVRRRAGELSEATGIDLIAHGTISDSATITDTAVAQPLIVGAGLLTLPAVLAGQPIDVAGLAAGHSVGEITAAAAVGVLTDADAIGFVAARGAGMAAASAATPTGMSAVLGGDADEVMARLGELGLTPANLNGAGQIVAAGALAQLAELAEHPPAKTRVIALKVAGAFHTGYMADAVGPLAALAGTLTPLDSDVPVLSNRDGRPAHDGAQILAGLVDQVTRPVRWDLCMETLVAQGVTGLIELAPAGTLVGLAKRGMRGVETLAVKTPDDLDVAAALIAAHSHGSVRQDQDA